jgi:Peptidase family S41
MMIAMILSAGVLAVSQTPGMTAPSALEDIALAREALERVHPGYDRYASRDRLDHSWHALEARAASGISREQLYLDLSLILADIRCDHTKAELPADLVEARNTLPVYLPFRFRVFGGRMYVDAPGMTGLQRGDEILMIDGISAAERLAAVYPYMPVDGFTDHVRWQEVQASSEFLGSGLDHFDPLLNAVGETVHLQAQRDGLTVDVEVERLTYPEFRALTGQTRWRNFSDEGNVTVDYPAAGVAVLNQGTFVNYRTPVDPASVYGPLFEDINARGTQTLIIDMRGNGGGSTDAQRGLLSHLLGEPYAPVREIRVSTYDFSGIRDYFQTWETAALNPDPAWFSPAEDGDGYLVTPDVWGTPYEVQPADNAFTGDVIILTGPSNASGATQLIGAMRDQRDALLIGEATGGSQEGPTANIIFFMELPNSGIRIRIPAQRSYQNIPDAVMGEGYSPDIETPTTLESWLAGDDLAIAAALDEAQN